MIDDQAAHNSCRISHEARLVRERRPIALGHVKISFVQKRGHAQSYGYAVPGQLSFGQSMQFRIESAKQCFGCGSIPFFGRRYE